MKAMLKSELARAAGVSVKTFNRWCKPHRKQLRALGWNESMKLLPPKVVKYVIEAFCIDEE